jgi:hypothetical protein
LDTNVIGNSGLQPLRRLFELGWLYLETPDTVEFELSFSRNHEPREDLLHERNSFPMSMGPAVLGHSKLGSSVLGSHLDGERLSEVHKLIWKTQTFQEDALVANVNTAARHRLHDSMIVATTIRYWINTLVSEDRALLAASPKLLTEFGMRVISIESASSEAFAAVAQVKVRALKMPDSIEYKNLPEWP